MDVLIKLSFTTVSLRPDLRSNRYEPQNIKVAHESQTTASRCQITEAALSIFNVESTVKKYFKKHVGITQYPNGEHFKRY